MKKNPKKKKNQPELPLNGLQGPTMATADVVARDRAREAAYERVLAALAPREEASDSGGSDGEAHLRSALRPLQLLQLHPPALQPRAAADILPPLAAALREVHPHDARFLDEYRLLLNERTEVEAQALTEELMQSVEAALSSGTGGAGAVVLASWLGAALAWRGPRVPGALPALCLVLHHFTSPQMVEMVRALHAALEPRELIAVSDAVRGAGSAASALLLRAALGKLVALEPKWEAGALDAAEVRAALTGPWGALGAAGRLVGLALAGRVLAYGGPAEELLAALAPPPPPPRDRQDPDYLKVNSAVKSLQNLFKDI